MLGIKARHSDFVPNTVNKLTLQFASPKLYSFP